MKRACKRHFLTRSANKHRTSRSCIHFRQEDATKADDHAYCMRYDSLTGRKQWMHKDELDAQNIRRSNISEAKGRKRPLDLCIPPNKRTKKNPKG